ncbi:hypothetical protein ABK040_008833 [Willaertia magna]
MNSDDDDEELKVSSDEVDQRKFELSFSEEDLDQDENVETVDDKQLENENEIIEKDLQHFNYQSLLKNDGFMFKTEEEKTMSDKKIEGNIKTLYEKLYIDYRNRNSLKKMDAFDLLYFMTNYREIDWDKLIYKAKEEKRRETLITEINKKERMKGFTMDKFEEADGNIIVQIIDDNPKETVKRELNQKIENSIKQILDVLYLPIKKGNITRPLMDFGPKKLKPKLRSIISSIVFKDDMYLEGDEECHDSDEETEVGQYASYDLAHKELEKMQKELHELRNERRSFNEKEHLLIEIVRDKMYEVANESKRQTAEIKQLKDQIVSRNKIIDKLNEMYNMDFQQLKRQILEKIEIGTLNAGSAELMLLTTMGGSVVNDISSLLEEERKKSQDTLKFTRATFDKEKKLIENQKLKEIQIWKQKLENIVNEKSQSNEQNPRPETSQSTKSVRKLTVELLRPKEINTGNRLLFIDYQKPVTIAPKRTFNLNQEFYEDNISGSDLDETNFSRKKKNRKKVRITSRSSTRDSSPSLFLSHNFDDPIQTSSILPSSIKDKALRDYFIKSQRNIELFRKQNKELKDIIRDRNDKIKEYSLKIKQFKLKNGKLKDEILVFKNSNQNVDDSTVSMKLQIRSLNEQLKRYSLFEKNLSRKLQKELDSQLQGNVAPSIIANQILDKKKRKSMRIIEIREKFDDLKLKVESMEDNLKMEFQNLLDVHTVGELQEAVVEAQELDSKYSNNVRKWGDYIKKTAMRKTKSQPSIAFNKPNQKTSDMGLSLLEDEALSSITKLSSFPTVKIDRIVQTDISLLSSLKENLDDQKLLQPYLGKLVNEHKDLDNVLDDFEKQYELSDKEKKALEKIKEKKQLLEFERQEKWRTVLLLANKIANYSMQNKRAPVPLVINTIDKAGDLQRDLSDHAKFFGVFPGNQKSTINSKSQRSLNTSNNRELRQETNTPIPINPSVEINNTINTSNGSFNINFDGEKINLVTLSPIAPLGQLQNEWEKERLKLPTITNPNSTANDTQVKVNRIDKINNSRSYSLTPPPNDYRMFLNSYKLKHPPKRPFIP